MHPLVNYGLSVNNLMLRAIFKTEDGLESRTPCDARSVLAGQSC